MDEAQPLLQPVIAGILHCELWVQRQLPTSYCWSQTNLPLFSESEAVISKGWGVEIPRLGWWKLKSYHKVLKATSFPGRVMMDLALYVQYTWRVLGHAYFLAEHWQSGEKSGHCGWSQWSHWADRMAVLSSSRWIWDGVGKDWEAQDIQKGSRRKAEI